MSRAQRFQRLLTAAERADAPFATIREYWRAPAPFEAERELEQTKLNEQIDAAVRRANPHPWEKDA